MSNVAEGKVSLSDAMEKLLAVAEEQGRKLQNVNPTQIRKFHGHIIKIWSKYIYNKKFYSEQKNFEGLRDELRFIKVFLAYQYARKEELKDLKKLIEPLIEEIKSPQDFEKFKKFYDAFLAYHKYYYDLKKGGAENE